MNILENQLNQFGFDPTRTRVYLALLELGSAKVHEIAKKARIPRPTAYDALNALVIAGLASFMERRGVRHYAIHDPRKLQRLLDEKQRNLDMFMPELLSLFSISSVQPRIRFYEGFEGIKTVLEDTLTSTEKRLRSILSVVDLFMTPGKEWMLDYVDRRVQNGIALRVIRSKPKEVREYWPTSRAALRELRYTPEGMVFTMTTYVYDNKVAFISSKRENFGLIMESEEVRETYTNLFESLWEMGKSTN